MDGRGWTAALLLWGAGIQEGGEPPRNIDREVRETLERLLDAGSPQESAAAAADLERLVAGDYVGVYVLWQREGDPRFKGILEHYLRLPEAREAQVVLRGRVGGCEQVQGGVVDYHMLMVTFGDLSVLKAPPDVGNSLGANRTLTVARGTSRDTWLCELLARDLQSDPGPAVWLFKPRDLSYPSETPGAPPLGLSLYEYRRLPPEAAEPLRQYLAQPR